MVLSGSFVGRHETRLVRKAAQSYVEGMNSLPNLPEEPDFTDLKGTRFAGLNRRQWLVGGSVSALGMIGAGYYYYQAAQPHLNFDGQYAYAGPELPPVIQAVVQFANELQSRPYVTGGGHQVLFDYGFDCSGAVSHVLYRAGLLRGPLTSAGFANYGQRGAGRYITLFVKPGAHVFMSICGLRFDTSGGMAGEGPRWRPSSRNANDFQIRHPYNL